MGYSGNYDIIFNDHLSQLSDDSGQWGYAIPPLALYASRDEDSILNWLTETVNQLFSMQTYRAEQMLRNINFYNGIQHIQNWGITTDSIQDLRGQFLDDQDVFVMNHARDFVNNKVASLTRYKPNVNVMPWNSTYRDRIAAKFSKRAIDTIFYHSDIGQHARDVCFHAACCGEGYFHVYYDKSKGDLTERQALSTVMGGQGGQMIQVDDYSDPIMLDIKERIGEVCVEFVYPWFILKEHALSYKDVKFIFKANIKHIDQVRLENPGVDIDTKSMGSSNKNPYIAYGGWVANTDYVIEIEFWHKRVEHLDSGFYAKFLPTTLLAYGPNPNSSGELPFARFTDYDDLITPHGRSFLQDIRPPLILHNKIMNLMYRNLAIAGHPKLMLPRGSANVNAMAAGGPFVVEYDPPNEPKIMTFNALGGEMFKLGDVFMNQIQQVAGVFGLSRGDTIPNARAASILNVYQELEDKRNGVQTDKWIACLEKAAKLCLDCAADNYKADDNRSIRIFGKNNQYKLRDLLDVSTLKGPSDVRIERTTSLAESKQGRIDQIQQLSSMPVLGPNGQPQAGLFTSEQIMRMIEIADTETFFDLATAAVDAAESENEDMYENLQVDAPSEWQQHPIHWNSHFKFIQSKEFSDTRSVPEEVRIMFLDHLALHEYYMYLKAKASFSYCQELLKLTEYPAVLQIGPDSGMPELQMTLNQIAMLHQMPPAPMMPQEPTPTE